MKLAHLIRSNKTIRHRAGNEPLTQGACVFFPSLTPSAVARLSVAGACWLALATAQAATPTDKYHYSRASSYTYDTLGRVLTETIEPGSPDHCVLTTYHYDDYGNRDSVKTESCSTTSTAAKFATRQSDVVYASQSYSYKDSSNNTISATIPAGIVPTDTYPVGNTTPADPLGRKVTQTFDPRFGVALQTTDNANSLSTTIGVDNLGRKVSETRPDGSITYTWYCLLADIGTSSTTTTNTVNVINSSNTACATPPSGENPTNAVMYVQTVTYRKDVVGYSTAYKPGPYSRVYTDRLGRTLRVATQSFDGSGQPSAKAAASIVQDTIYNAYGVAVVQTQPYFLSSKSSTLSGSSDRGLSKTVVDALGRPTTVYSTDAQGSQSVDFGSDLSGSAFGTIKAAQQTFSYTGLSVTTTNDKGQTRTEDKNLIGELVRVTDANGAQLVHQRDAFGNLVETKDALQNHIYISYDIRGNKVQMTDPDKGLLQYCYDALGQLKAQQNSTMRGNRTTASACPSDTGTGITAVTVTKWTTFAYDTLGRMTQRIEPESTSTWAYDKYADGTACSKGIGKLCETKTSTPGMSRKVAYDSVGRPSKTLVDMGSGTQFASALDYDTNSGRLTAQTYPTGVKVGYSYTTLGALEKVTLQSKVKVSPLPNAQGVTAATATYDVGSANSVLWQAKQVNAWGKSEQQSYGNGVSATASYEALTGRTASLLASSTSISVMSQTYSWDSNNNLTARSDAIGDGSGAVSETFVYGDKLNRLTSYTVSGPHISNLNRTVYLSYNALGQLLYKSDVGLYTYGTSGQDQVRPHALKHMEGFAGQMPNTDYTYDDNGNVKTASAGKYRSLSYTSFDLPDGGSGIQGPNGTPQYSWAYDENHGRIKEVRVIAGTAATAGTRTTWSLHPDNLGALSFEREVNSPTTPSTSNPAVASNRHYISAGGQVVAVLVSTGDLPTNGSLTTAPTPTTASIDSATSAFKLVKMEYWHKDHLGSLVATTDHTGTTVTARYAYDPFGKRRDSTGSYDAAGNVTADWNPALNAGTDRGYTGHEHLDDIGIIHMNGRLFDATLGIFLQVDPYVTYPGDLQNYNRYGYCLNNPLTCIDPSGFQVVVTDIQVNNSYSFSSGGGSNLGSSFDTLPEIVVSAPREYFKPPSTPAWNLAGQFDQGHLGGGSYQINNGIGFGTSGGSITSGTQIWTMNCGYSCWQDKVKPAAQTTSPTSGSGGGFPTVSRPVVPTPPVPIASPNKSASDSFWRTNLNDIGAAWSNFNARMAMTPADVAVYEKSGGSAADLYGTPFDFVPAGAAFGAIKLGGSKLVAGMGGRFANLVGSVGDGLTAHHIPQAALDFTGRADGGAIVMTTAEHVATRTFGFKGAVTAIEDAATSFRDVLAKDIKDVRDIVGSRYNQGLKDVLKYYRENFPDLMAKEVK